MNNCINKFKSAAELCTLIDAYFDQIEAGQPMEAKSKNKPDERALVSKTTSRNAEPVTIAGLIFFLGFNSREEFEQMESRGKYSSALKRARLRVEAAYEKKLHQQSSTGVIFALKSFGWNERDNEKASATKSSKMTVKIIESGPTPVSNEKEVILS